MTDQRVRCPSCGTPGTTFLEGRLCPSCLLRLALAATADDQGAEGAPAPAERYVVRAVMDDCPDATAYLAEDSASCRLVRLEVGKRPCEMDPDEVRARVESLQRLAPAGTARVLDGGLTPDGRPWLVAERTPAARTWLLTLALTPQDPRSPSSQGSPPRPGSGP